MKTLAVLVILGAAGGGAYYGATYQPTAPMSTVSFSIPKQIPPTERPPIQFETTQPVQFSGPNPPPPLPASLTCTVMVGGSTAGSFPFTWDGSGWSGTVSAGSSGNRVVLFNVYRGAQIPGGELYGFTVSPLGSATHLPSQGHYGRFISATPFQTTVDVTYEWKGFVGGATVVFVFSG